MREIFIEFIDIVVFSIFCFLGFIIVAL